MHAIESVFLGKKKRRKKSVMCFSFFVVQLAALRQQFAFSVGFLKILFSYSKVACSSICGALGAETVD